MVIRHRTDLSPELEDKKKNRKNDVKVKSRNIALKRRKPVRGEAKQRMSKRPKKHNASSSSSSSSETSSSSSSSSGSSSSSSSRSSSDNSDSSDEIITKKPTKKYVSSRNVSSRGHEGDVKGDVKRSSSKSHRKGGRPMVKDDAKMIKAEPNSSPKKKEVAPAIDRASASREDGKPKIHSEPEPGSTLDYPQDPIPQVVKTSGDELEDSVVCPPAKNVAQSKSFHRDSEDELKTNNENGQAKIRQREVNSSSSSGSPEDTNRRRRRSSEEGRSYRSRSRTPGHGRSRFVSPPPTNKRRYSPEMPQPTKVHVGNLSRNVTQDHLKEIFDNFGPIKMAEINVDSRRPWLSRGSGYVEFEQPSGAKSAVEKMNGGQIDGQEVVVNTVLVNQRKFAPVRRIPSPRRRQFSPRRWRPSSPRRNIRRRSRSPRPRGPFRRRSRSLDRRSRSPFQRKTSRSRSPPPNRRRRRYSRSSRSSSSSS